MSDNEVKILTLSPIDVLQIWKQFRPSDFTKNYHMCFTQLASRARVLNVELKLVDASLHGVNPNTPMTAEAIEALQVVRRVESNHLLQAKADGIPVTCNQMYDAPVQEVSTDPIYDLRGCYFNHLEGVLDHGTYDYDTAKINTDSRVVVKYHKNFDFDGRRFWRLSSLWFDGEPVAVLQNAGREGDDHSRRFITDRDKFLELCSYLRSCLKQDTNDAKIDSDVTDGDTEIGLPLIEFYGNKLGGHFERY